MKSSSVFSKVFITFCLLFATLFAAIFACGSGYHSFITPKSSWGEFQGISGDTWLVDGAVMSFANLATRSNKLELNFSAWHPSDKPKAHLEVAVCGQVVSDFVVEPASKQVVYLTGVCEPRKVEFKVINPFFASATDSRRLGAQLESVKVTSRLGLPLLNCHTIFKYFIPLFFIVLCFYRFLISTNFFSTKPILTLLASCLFPFLAIYFFQVATLSRPDKLCGIALFILALFYGLSLKARDDNNKSYVSTIAVFVVVVLAGFLRAYGLSFGLPANYHPDEVPKFNVIMTMYNDGTFNPNYFLHPTLLLYSTFFSNTIIHNLFNICGYMVAWQDTVVLAGRIVSMLAGTLSVYFIYLIGKRLFSAETGLMAAFFLAVMPLHVTCSRYVKEDALLTCFILACVVVLLKAVYEQKRYLLLLAGFLAGCSAGTKYSGILSSCLIVAAPWLASQSFKPDKKWFLITIIALICVPLGFLVCTPYSILNHTRFVHDFLQEKNHMQNGHFIAIDAWSYFWMYHFKRSILVGCSYPLALCGVIGGGFLLRKFKISAWYVIAAFLLFYLPAEYVKAKPAPQPERYILPCLPFLALAAASFLQNFKSKKFVAVLFTALLVMPTVRTMQLGSEIVYDTREKMRDWMKENLPAGSVVAVDWKYYAFPFKNEQWLSLYYLDRKTILEQFEARNLKKTGADYLLVSSLFYDRYFNQQERAGAMNREKMRRLFKSFPILHQEESLYGSYGFHNPKLTLFSLKELS